MATRVGMTWDEFYTSLAKSGLPYLNIGEEEDGTIVVAFDLKEKRDAGGNIYLARVDEFDPDASEEAN